MELPAGFKLTYVCPGEYQVVKDGTNKAFISRHANEREWELGFEPGAFSGVYSTLNGAVIAAINTLRHRVLLGAKEFANKKHASQLYGSSPYTYHLEAVVQALLSHGNCDEAITIAAWLHDTLEDTDTTKEELEKEFGLEVANIVFAVTDEPGKNRDERHAKTYSKIASTPKAGVLKLADRVANVQCALSNLDNVFQYIVAVDDKVKAVRENAKVFKTNDRLFRMYKKENEEFLREVADKSVDKDNPCFISLVKKLKKMMETEQP